MSVPQQDLNRDLKQLIIDALGLEDISVQDIDDEQPCSAKAWAWTR